MVLFLSSSSSTTSSPLLSSSRRVNTIFIIAATISLLIIQLLPCSVDAFTRSTSSSRNDQIRRTTTCPTPASARPWKQQQHGGRQHHNKHTRQQQQQQDQRLNLFQNHNHYHGATRSSSTRLYSIFYDDFEDFYSHDNNNNDEEASSKRSTALDINSNSNTVNDDNDDADLFASLKARQTAIQQEKKQVRQEETVMKEEDRSEAQRLRFNWDEANCLSTVRVTLDDWVRRLAVDLYPLVVCGSARGNLYLADLEEGDVMDCLEKVHTSEGILELITSSSNSTTTTNGNNYPNHLAQCLKALYDGHDGNGPLAIAVKKDLIVSSGREGGIHACTIVGKEVDVPSGTRGGTTKQTKLKLQREGKFRGLEESRSPASSSSPSSPPPLITSLAFDDRGTLWAGSYDEGIVRGYQYEEYDLDDRPLMVRQKSPDYSINVGAPILDMNIQDETGILVVTTETQGVFLYSLDENDTTTTGGNGKKLLLHVDPFSGRSYVTRDGEGTVISSGQKQFCRTAMIVRNDNATTTTTASSSSMIINEITDKEIGKSTQSLIIGGSFGHIYQYTIRLYGNTTTITSTSPTTVTMVSAESMQKIRPKHMGPVVSLASPSPGLFITASHDGTMRVWDCGNNDENGDDEDENSFINVEKLVDEEVAKMLDDDKEGDENDDDDDDDSSSISSSSTIETTKAMQEEPRKKTKKQRRQRPNVLYALSGYKVWLGSVFANERKLVSDGADNTIIVHSFDEDDEVILRSQQEDDEDDQLGGDEDPFGLLS